MSAEGRVVVDLRRGEEPRVAFTRPGEISRLLVGKPASSALQLIPAIFSVCRVAQSHAAVSALAQADDIAVAPDVDLARQAVVLMENLREHLLRVIVDWPRLCGQNADPALARPAMALPARLEAALFENGGFVVDARRKDNGAAGKIVDEAEALLSGAVFGTPPATWLGLRGREAIAVWAAGAGTSATGFIHSLQELGDAECANLPVVAGCGEGDFAPCDLRTAAGGGGIVGETTAMSRNLFHPLVASLETNGLLARHLARLVELAELPGRLRRLLTGQGRPTAGGRQNGGGWARVGAARGDLVHLARLRDGLVKSYEIIPPTRWNFAPTGAAARGLAEILRASRPDAVKRRAELLINAFDPCVGYELRVS